METNILVIGSLGNVGAEVVKALISRGVRPRAADRRPERVTERFGAAVDAVRFDFADPSSYGATFAGIERLFLVRPPQLANPKHDLFPALEAAKVAGVRRVVFLSLIGIEDVKAAPHFKIEAWLRASGLDFTFLRASFFMQNLGTTHREEIRDRDEIFIPVGAARTAFVDVRDLGEVAALALTEDGHAGKAYDLTGSEALGYDEVAAIFSRELGRTIRYRNPSATAFLVRQLRNGHPLMYAFVTTWLYGNTRKGLAERVTGTARELLGRDPIPLERYVREHRGLWIR